MPDLNDLRDFEDTEVEVDTRPSTDADPPCEFITGEAGTGKCLGAGTKVLMHDGSLKVVEAVRVGDRLMGPDSKPRRVLHLGRGNSAMYTVIPVKGDRWTCNEDHILVLSGTNRHKGETLEISVREYLANCAKGPTFKTNWKLVRSSGIEFPASLQPLPLDPYLAGVWIGDGGHNSPVFHLNDTTKMPIAEFLTKVAATLGLRATHHRATVSKHATIIRLCLMNTRKGKDRYQRHPLKQLLAASFSDGVKGRKVPQCYLTTSVADRLSLLAGLLDTDGAYNHGGGFEFCTKYRQIAESVIFICRSLGFAAYYGKDKIVNRKRYYRLSLSGELSLVPCLVVHKKVAKRRQIKRVTVTGFRLRSIGLGNYYGFTLDGDGCFLLGDFTITHNTFSIKQRIDDDPTYGALCASTGIAAVNLGAITINSMLGYFDTASMEDAYQRGFLSAKINSLYQRGFKRIIVDEASMVDKNQLNVLYNAVKDVNGYKSVAEPMGITLVGDLCLAMGTLVMMADGSLKAVERLLPGEQVMGPDSKPRSVLRVRAGSGSLYRVDQTNGDSYTVNENHLLALMRGVDGQRHESWGKRYPRVPNSLIMSVRRLSEASQKFRECFVGYKAGVIAFPERRVTIDPYYLGYWLGDGDWDFTRVTTEEPEVLEYCSAYAASLGMETSTHGWGRTQAQRVRITNGMGQKNPLLDRFRSYGLMLDREKFIPDDYLYNTEENRLRLLAGMADSDGSWGDGRFRIANVNKRLALQFKLLADQLGFRTGFFSQHNDSWIVSVGGNTWRIPTRVARKQSSVRSLVRSRLTSVLQITNVGVGDYVGFETDDDHLFLLGDGTVTHNCQLPPVCKGSKAGANPLWLFKADCWEKFAQNTTRLTKVWRQTHPEFLQAINHLRRGEGGQAAEILHTLTRFEPSANGMFDGTTIVALNDEVERHNAIRLGKVAGRPVLVTSRRWGKQSGEWRKNIPEQLQLKVGAYVMVLANDSPAFTYVNGDTGYIENFDPVGEVFTIKLVRTGNNVEIRKIHRTVTSREPPMEDPHGPWAEASGQNIPFGRVSYDESRDLWHLGGILYYPLRLAWASTVHKSQGLSLDKCQIDIRHQFCGQPSMTYVAISRCRTPGGLRLVGTTDLLTRRCNVDPEVVPWL